MKIIKYPQKGNWRKLCLRPSDVDSKLSDTVSDIILQVQNFGDEALIGFASRFDKVELTNLEVSAAETESAQEKVPAPLKSAIQKAKKNIEKFHLTQLQHPTQVETAPGIRCWRKQLPIEKVGLYVPGGTAPLISTVLMLAIPARIAGCKEVVLCTPPTKDGSVNPAILYAASLTGVTRIIKTGGAQAIAALAYGTETVPEVHKIFGPGNRYVTAAKQYVSMNGVAIDMPAGPSEVLIIADKHAHPDFIAADLLSQAEHGSDSQSVLVTTDEKLIREVETEVQIQLEKLPRADLAHESLKKSFMLLFRYEEECLDFSNVYAPEHLILSMKEPEKAAESITNAGSVFLGNYSPESAGDYASGTNHTLPTNGFAKAWSGVSVDTFMKNITFQKLSEEGLQNIAETVTTLAEAEGLTAHANAVRVRLKTN